MLGLTPEGYAVYYIRGTNVPYDPPMVAYLGAQLLFFVSWNDAKNAADAFRAQFQIDANTQPPCVWIQPISRLWLNGVQQ